MTTFQEPIKDQEATIIAPVVKQVLNVFKAKWLYDRDVELIYTDHTGQQHTIGSRVGEEHQVRLDTQRRIECKALTTTLDDVAYRNNPNDTTEAPIWEDKLVPARVNLNRNLTNVTVTLKYTASSKADVNHWLNVYHSRMGMGHGQISLSVDYEVIVPDIIPYILKAINTQWVEKSDTPRDFMEFLAGGFNTAYNIQQSPNNPSSRKLVLPERLHNVCVLVPTELPQPSRIEGGAYEAELTLKFDINVPSMLTMAYSEFVGGSPLPDALYDMDLNRNAVVRRGYLRGEAPDVFMGYLMDDSQEIRYTNSPYVYPAYDTVNVNLNSYKVNPVLQIRVGVTNEDKRTLLNLNDIEGALNIKLHPDLIPFLKASKKTVFKLGFGLFSLALARDGVILTADYSLDDDLNIVAGYDMDPMGNYHLLLVMNGDLSFMGFVESGRAFNYGELFIASVMYGYPLVKPEFLPTLHEGSVLRDDAIALLDHIPAAYRGVNTKLYTASTIYTVVK